MIDESNLIRALQKDFPGFIGDDAAVIPVTGGESYVITNDLFVEDVHFRTEYFSPKDLAHKGLHVNLSDLAAMGATPLYILCGISIPRSLHEYAIEFLKYFNELSKALEVNLIGGDTTASQNKLFISITAIGIAKDDQIKYRSKSKPGDVICIAGNIGFAHMGFLSIEDGTEGNPEYVASFLRPEAKIKEGEWLAKHKGVHSMIDVSDGLYIDLKKLCSASKKGAIIDLDLLAKYLEPEISLQNALEGGEDYSLLCAVDSKSFESLAEEFAVAFGYELKAIGQIASSEDEISFQKDGKKIDMSVNSFTHFGES